LSEIYYSCYLHRWLNSSIFRWPTGPDWLLATVFFFSHRIDVSDTSRLEASSTLMRGYILQQGVFLK
jgi:hypothetical protein